jgi:hypothetical protein
MAQIRGVYCGVIHCGAAILAAAVPQSRDGSTAHGACPTFITPTLRGVIVSGATIRNDRQTAFRAGLKARSRKAQGFSRL